MYIPSHVGITVNKTVYDLEKDINYIDHIANFITTKALLIKTTRKT